MAHVTGQTYWDIPKGIKENGESPLAAALRETQEETGIRLAGQTLFDLGEMAYLSGKRLHLFAVSVSSFEVDTATCLCTSTFKDWKTGKDMPEADRFQWVPLADVRRHCAKRMGALLMEEGVLEQAESMVRSDGRVP